MFDRIKSIIQKGAIERVTDKRFFELELDKWIESPARKDMVDGDRYYKGDHDILKRVRTVIGESGELKAIYNLPNNRMVDNQYGKLVDQKKNYLFGKPVTFKSDDKKYVDILGDIFDKKFVRLLKSVGEGALNSGLAWVYVYYDDKGRISFKKFDGFEILPFWRDKEHTQLDCAIRVYVVDVYDGNVPSIMTKVEVYTLNGISYYEYKNGTLIPDVERENVTYIIEDSSKKKYNWDKIPLIPFKYNNKEIPLIKRVKTLQDGLNMVVSDFQNDMQENNRNTILVIKNYDGTNLGEFRHNLSTYGAVKVRSVDGADGGVEALKVEVNAQNYQTIYDMLKKAIIENGRGFDAKNDKLTGNPNQMNIQSMYSDIDLDANEMETEFQASFEDLLYFINCHLQNTGVGNFDNSKVEVIFNRDMLMNEGDIINNCQASLGMISQETVIANHPWVNNVEKEIKQVEKEQNVDDESYGMPISDGKENE